MSISDESLPAKVPDNPPARRTRPLHQLALFETHVPLLDDVREFLSAPADDDRSTDAERLLAQVPTPCAV
jgi:hypothetical protein